MSDTSVQQQLDQIRDDVTRLRGDVAELLKALAGSGRREADGLAGKAKDRLRAAAESLSTATACTRETVAAVESQVRAYPLLSLAGAFSLGCWLGKHLGRGK